MKTQISKKKIKSFSVHSCNFLSESRKMAAARKCNNVGIKEGIKPSHPVHRFAGTARKKHRFFRAV
jgi:hypothetical protein